MLGVTIKLPDLNNLHREIEQGAEDGLKDLADAAVQFREDAMNDLIYSKPLPKGSQPRRGRKGGLLGATRVKKAGKLSYVVGPDSSHEGQEEGLAHRGRDINGKVVPQVERAAAKIVGAAIEKRLRARGLI